MRNFSISDKLILAAIFLSAVIIVIVASYSFIRARDAILSRSFDQLISVRVIKKNQLEEFFNTITKEVNLVSSSSDIHAISKHIDYNKKYSVVDCTNSSNNFVNAISTNNFNKISIVTNSHNLGVLYSQEILTDSNTHFYDSLASTIQYSGYPVLTEVISNNNVPSHKIIVSTHLTDNSGIIFFEIDRSKIDSIMLEQGPAGGLGNSGESYLVGSDKLMRSSSRFQDSSVLITKVLTVVVDSALTGKTGTQIIEDYRGISVLSSYGDVTIPNLRWAIIAEIDYKEVTVPIYRIRNEIVFVSIFIFCIVLIVVFVLSQKITNPIKRLNNAARKLGEGNFNVEIKHTLNDEIGDLTNSFNKMVASLKESSRELEEERIKSLRSLIDGQETERQRLSRELHDSLGQWLIGLKLKYESCLNNNDKTSADFEQLGQLFDKTIDETRRISNNLMPAALSEFGLITAVRNICNSISDTSNIVVVCDVTGTNTSLSKKDNIYIFRIIQEGLTNIIKHSNASRAVIIINFHENESEIIIKDNGHGFDPDKVNKTNSSGLRHINERVTLLGGNAEIISGSNKGSTIKIRIPKK